MQNEKNGLRPILVVLAVLVALFAAMPAASASPQIDRDLTVVSSTVLGEESFTMTVSNGGIAPIDVNLSPPGLVSAVAVDTGEFDGTWTIAGLGVGVTAMMVGHIKL